VIGPVPATTERFLDRYRHVNAGYGDPLVYELTQRGFFSEVNNALNAVLFGAVTGRRVSITESKSGGWRWTDLFEQSPALLQIGIGDADPEWVLSDPKQQNFRGMRWQVRQWHRFGRPVLCWRLRLVGSVFSTKRRLARVFCCPSGAEPQLDALTRPFAAFHVRRGDKLGYVRHERHWVEGEKAPLTRYLDRLAREAPGLKRVFIMTDDYTVMEEFRHLAPDISFETLCEPGQRGHYEAAFNALTREHKLARLRLLVGETRIAARSSVFSGCFKSNVSRFVALTHERPARCLSVDSQRTWHPV
jgi:hypothetical protein